MANHSIEYQLRIRNAANSADALTITSIRGGTNPWLGGAPSGDGQSFDPLTGQADSGAFSGIIVDGITSGTNRVVTSQLEDAGYRQQLMDRRAFVEYRLDGGSWLVLVAGFLTGLRLVSGIEYEYTVSEPMRAEREYMAFAPKTDTGNRDNKETVAAFLARWPKRGCIFGGPIIGGWLGRADYGGWEMQVSATSSGSTYLKFVAGYAAPDFTRSTNAEQCMTLANVKTDPVFGGAYIVRSSISTFQDARDGQWPGLVVEIVGTGYYAPYSGLTFPGFNSEGGLNRHLLKDIRMRGIFILGTPLGTGSTIRRVRCFTAEPSDLSPIYLDDHPCDVMASLWSEAGQSYSASAVTTCKNLIGAHRRHRDRITAPQPLSQYLASLRATYGIGIRTNSAGELEMFSSRIFTNTPPTTAITTADVVQESGSAPAWEIDQSSAIKKITFTHQRFALTQSNPDETFAQVLDGIVTSENIIERTNGDPGAVGNRVEDYKLNGMMGVKDSYEPDTGLIDAMALEIFDRYGRGLIRGSVSALRGGSTDSVLLGDEVLNNLPRIPNHNKRLGDDLSVAPRAMQVTRLTWTPRGPILVLEDSGPNEQPYATVPTLTIAASSANPRTVAEVTITNAATLNADSAGLRLQMAVTTGAAPALTDYTDVAAFGAGVIPTGAISLPALVSGRKVYARALATKAGVRFSAWSTGVSVTLTAVPPVTSLAAAAVAGDGSTEQLTWTAGDTTSVLDIFLRVSGAPSSDAIRIDSIPPGSTQYVVQGLTPSTAYTASVQARDAATGDVSTLVDVTFTTGATVVTLAAPVYANGFSGSLDPDTGVPIRDGVYGIAVVAASNPGLLEVAVAVETSVGAGTYGSFVTSGTVVPNVLANWTIWSDVAPNDGLRRQLKARHVRDGATASAYTAVVTVTPWTPVGLPGFPTELVCQIVMLAPSPATEAGVNIRFQITGIDPIGATPEVEIVALYPTSAMTVVSGAAVGTPAANNSVWKVSQPIPTAGPGTLVARALVGDRFADQTISVPEATTIAPAQGTVAIDSDGNWETTVDCASSANSFRYMTSTSAFPADATVLASGTVVTSRTGTITGGPLSFGQTIYVTAVPFLNSSGTGTSLPAIHLRGAYLTYTATKTVGYSRTSFVRTYTTGTGPFEAIYDSSGSPTNDAMTATGLVYFRMTATLPVGVTLTSASFDCVWNSATTKLGAFAQAVYKANTLLNSGAATYAAGAQTVTMSLASAVAASEAILLHQQFTGPASGTADASQATIKDVFLTYTMPDPKKTV